MSYRTIALLLLFVVLASSLLGGCSGSGMAPDQIVGGTIHTAAADHLSVVCLLTGWLRSLYYRNPLNGYDITVDEYLPDGTYHFAGTNSDGSTFEFWQAEDYSGRCVMTWPDLSVVQTYGPPSMDGDLFYQEIDEEWSTGLRVTSRVDADLSLPDPPQVWTGEARIPGDKVMHYVLNRAVDHDRLVLVFPDQSRLQFDTPIAPAPGAACWPQFAQGAQVTFTSGGRTLTYRLTGRSEDWWDEMEFESDFGLSGSFAVDDHFLGSGQLQENGVVAGALRWDAELIGRLNLLGAGQEEVTPSAAARDFRLDQWANHSALLGPTPF